MLVSGCSDALITKFQDMQCLANCNGSTSSPPVYFNQPVFQTLQMFLAEMTVGLVVLAQRLYDRDPAQEYAKLPDTENTAKQDQTVESPVSSLTGKRILLLAVPSTCDIIGSTLLNVGLLLLPVSIFQMVRGAVVLFVGSFSVVFLKRVLIRKQWAGLGLVTAGVFVVGLSAVRHEKSAAVEDGWKTLFGVLMILLAQVFTASQFVIEEFILQRYTMEPSQVVAWEGTFGTLITIAGSTLIYLVSPHSSAGTNSMFNLAGALSQIIHHGPLLASFLLILVSLSSFNVSGLTVTSLLSATSRSTIDTCRTLGIWAVSLCFGWESFELFQLVGFVVLVFGTLLFNGVIFSDEVKPPPRNKGKTVEQIEMMER